MNKTTKTIGRVAAGAVSAGIFLGVGASYAGAEVAIPSGSAGIINSGGASGSSEPKAIPDTSTQDEVVIYDRNWGPFEAPMKVTPVASTVENNAALDNFSKITGAAVTGGGLVGTGVGAVIGCVVGGVALPAIGCIPGAITGAGIGGVVGTLAVGGGAAIATGVDLAQTYMAEPGTTHWAPKN